eukprot:TRINITY_DN41340_c0_g1_i1.p1 TRINITY_DN41340_c0_g1~~TRINITY_DN41340_c0_g1_i1.p1  ORF type:complete len:261 (+),score=71.70 TRINITY_DN41340_c0_g1_i1:108-890(+)
MRVVAVPLLALCLALVASENPDQEAAYEGGAFEETQIDTGAGADDTGPSKSSIAAPASAVYVMEHGFLDGGSPKWTPRGTMMLSGDVGSLEAMLSDAKEFVGLKPELQSLLKKAANDNQYYAIRMYNPESPRRVLQAAIPANLLADHFEDWHDIFEVSVGTTGVPVGLSYRVKHTLGLILFDHTQVHLSEPLQLEGPRVPQPVRDAAGNPRVDAKGQPAEQQSFLRRYWWVIILVLLLLSSVSDDGQQGGKGGGGGGGKK